MFEVVLDNKYKVDDSYPHGHSSIVNSKQETLVKYNIATNINAYIHTYI